MANYATRKFWIQSNKPGINERYKQMKKTITVLCCLWVLIFCLPVDTSAHSGRTDGKGGHTDKSTGDYHYHHGYSAHDHWDIDGDGAIDCPYNFEDKTNHGSNGSVNSTTESSTKTQDNTTPQRSSKSKNKNGGMIFVCIAIFYLVPFLLWFFFVMQQK